MKWGVYALGVLTPGSPWPWWAAEPVTNTAPVGAWRRPMFARDRGERQRWYTIENKSSAETDVHIYDEIGCWGISSSDFVKDFKSIKSKTINVHINSPGGEVYDGLAIYNSMAQHAAHVVVWIDGLAASAASFIAMAGDEIKIARNAEMMIHDASCAVWGNAAEHLLVVERLNKMSENIADIYARRSGKPAAYWREQMRADNGLGTFYSGPEAVTAGLADEIVGETEDAKKARDRWDLSIFNRAQAPRDPLGDGDDPGSGAPDGSDGPPSSDPSALPDDTTEEVEPVEEVTENLENLDLELTINVDAFRAELDPDLEMAMSADDLRVTMRTAFEADQPAPEPAVSLPSPQPINFDRLEFEQTLREVLFS